MSPSKWRCVRVVRVGSMQCDMQESFRLRRRTVTPARCYGRECDCELKHVQCKSWSMATSDPGLDVGSGTGPGLG